MKCRICGNSNLDILTNRLRRGEGTVWFCPDCKYGMLEPCFEDAQEYYDKEYRKHFKNNLTEKERESARSCYEMQKNYQDERISIIRPYFDRRKDFLEIGSSAGQFLSHIVGEFRSLTGVELDTSCAAFSRELIIHMGGSLTVYTDSIENIIWEKNEKFHYIGFFQVLEHIAHPVAFLEKVRERMTDDGRVFIEVPNLDDPLLKLWDVPAYERFYYHEAHLSYFSERSLALLLGKSGFKVDAFYYLQDYNLLNNLFWYFNNKPQDSCEFGLSKPHINFKEKGLGGEVNALFEKMNEEYVRILAKHKMTSNIFLVAKAL